MEEKRFAPIGFDGGENSLATSHLASFGAGLRQRPRSESFLKKLWQGKWILLWSSVAFALIALMFGSLQPPLYAEQTSIEIRSPDTFNPLLKQFEADNNQPYESYIQTQIRIIESRSLLERALAKLPDSERTRLLAVPRFWWKRTSYEQSVESVRKHLSAQPSAQAGIIDISFFSTDAEAGAHFLNILTQQLADVNVERTWRVVQNNRHWAERQIDDLRRKWEQSEQMLAEYKESIGFVASRTNAPFSESSAKAVLPSAASRREGEDLQLRQMKNKLAELDKQIAQWEALYGTSGSSTRNLKSQRAEVVRAMRQRVAINRSDAQRDAPLTAPSSYAVISSPEQRIRPRPPTAQVTAHLNALQQEAESNRTAYESTATRWKEASFSSSPPVGDISVVDPAVAVGSPSTPGQFLTGSLGALTGLLLATGFVAVRDRFSNTFSDPALLAEHLGLQVLGSIPSDRLSQQDNTYNSVTQEPGLQLNFENNLRTAEAFRSIRSSILLRWDDRSGPRRLVFTSATTAEGKTFVVVNLGAALASAQRRVLLVDGNLRNPSLHKVFGAGNDHGLADLLSRQISEQPITSRDVIRETQIPDLYLLSAGLAGIKAPEILSSVQLPQLLREFAKGFDFVLLDSPPILPYSDARSLARSADAVVLVVKAGSTTRQSAVEARDAIGQDGAAILGSILTEWEAATSG